MIVQFSYQWIFPRSSIIPRCQNLAVRNLHATNVTSYCCIPLCFVVAAHLVMGLAGKSEKYRQHRSNHSNRAHEDTRDTFFSYTSWAIWPCIQFHQQKQIPFSPSLKGAAATFRAASIEPKGILRESASIDLAYTNDLCVSLISGNHVVFRVQSSDKCVSSCVTWWLESERSFSSR